MNPEEGQAVAAAHGLMLAAATSMDARQYLNAMQDLIEAQTALLVALAIVVREALPITPEG